MNTSPHQQHLWDLLRRFTEAVVAHWESDPPREVSGALGDAIDQLRIALTQPPSRLLRVARLFADTALAEMRCDSGWGTPAIGALAQGIESVCHQLHRSPASQQVLNLCDEVRGLWGQLGAPAEGSPEHLEALAALMCIEDTQCSIEGYVEGPEFESIDAAYLKKLGFLQAVQLQLDAVEALASGLGTPLRVGRQALAKAPLLTRHIAAGHPLGGRMDGASWQHFQDRSTIRDRKLIGIMSFEAGGAGNWTGQTRRVPDLIQDTHATTLACLEKIAAHLRMELANLGNSAAAAGERPPSNPRSD